MKYIPAIILGLAFIAGTALYLQARTDCVGRDTGLGGVACRDAVRDDIRLPSPLPTIKEIQERIGAKPDGILGQETQRLWDEAICNQYGIYYCEEAGM